MSDPAAVPSYPFTPPRAPERARVGAVAHVVSVVICLVLVPLALLLLDYAYTRGWGRIQAQFGGQFPVGAMLALIVGTLLLLVVAASSRLSGVGALLAGLLYGALPTLVILIAPLQVFKVPRHLPHLYTGIGYSVVGSGSFVFPVLAATLLGAAVGGRWLRR